MVYTLLTLTHPIRRSRVTTVEVFKAGLYGVESKTKETYSFLEQMFVRQRKVTMKSTL